MTATDTDDGTSNQINNSNRRSNASPTWTILRCSLLALGLLCLHQMTQASYHSNLLQHYRRINVVVPTEESSSTTADNAMASTKPYTKVIRHITRDNSKESLSFSQQVDNNKSHNDIVGEQAQEEYARIEPNMDILEKEEEKREDTTDRNNPKDNIRIKTPIEETHEPTIRKMYPTRFPTVRVVNDEWERQKQQQQQQWQKQQQEEAQQQLKEQYKLEQRRKRQKLRMQQEWAVLMSDENPHRIENLKIPFPVFVPSLPKSGTTSIHQYFICGGHKSAHHVYRDTEGRVQNKLGRCIETNLKKARRQQKQQPNFTSSPLEGCGGYDIWTDTGTFMFCFRLCMQDCRVSSMLFVGLYCWFCLLDTFVGTYWKDTLVYSTRVVEMNTSNKSKTYLAIIR